MAAFVRRRLGREVFDRLVEPLVSAVYAADMEQLSVLATLAALPRDGARARQPDPGDAAADEARGPKAASESGARYSMFVTLRDGLTSMVEAIAARLPPGCVRLNSPVERIERDGEGGGCT